MWGGKVMPSALQEKGAMEWNSL